MSMQSGFSDAQINAADFESSSQVDGHEGHGHGAEEVREANRVQQIM